MLLKNKKVAIIGGGPAGLTLAKLLQNDETEVKVYERDFDKNARVQGSLLDLHDDSGLAAIKKANLLEEFRSNFLPGADKCVILNEKAELFFTDHDSQSDFDEAHFRPEIDRGSLRKILLESLPPETVIWDRHFLEMKKEDEGWRLHFKNGTSDYADLVIAADGANSKIRPYVTDIKPFYSGVTMIDITVYDGENKLLKIAKLLNGGKEMAFHNEKCILGGQKGGGDMGFYLSLKKDENWSKNNAAIFSDKDEFLQWFKNEYSDWDVLWQEIIKHADTIVPRPIYCVPYDQKWESQQNVTLIGDAAHVMPPFAGEGANMAMLDSLQLSENLLSEQYKTIQEAIAAYEENMWKTSSSATKESLENGERMHSQKALEYMVQLFKGE